MNKITLIRPKESVNRSYSYPILINGKHVTDLNNDSEEVLTLDDDKVTMEAKVGWAGSTPQEIDFRDTDHITLKIHGNRFYNCVVRYWGAIAFPLLATTWILANHIPTINYGIPIFGTGLLLYLVYTLTINRNNWISITEMNS